jgi:hypothetical protein
VTVKERAFAPIFVIRKEMHKGIVSRETIPFSMWERGEANNLKIIVKGIY